MPCPARECQHLRQSFPSSVSALLHADKHTPTHTAKEEGRTGGGGEWDGQGEGGEEKK